MVVRITADSADELSEPLRSYTKDTDIGGVIVNVEELPENISVGDDIGAMKRGMHRVKSDFGEVKRERDEAREVIKQYERLPVEKVDAAIDALEQKEAGKLRGSREIDEFKSEVERKAQRRIAEYEAQLAQERENKDQIQQRWLDSWADERVAAACAENGAKSSKVIRSYLKSQMKVGLTEEGQPEITLLDDDGQTLFSSQEGKRDLPMQIGERVAQLRGAEETRGLFSAPSSGGAGGASQFGGAGREAAGLDITKMSPVEIMALEGRT